MIVIAKLLVARRDIKVVKSALQSRNQLVEPLRFDHHDRDGQTIISVVSGTSTAALNTKVGNVSQARLLEVLFIEHVSSLVESVDFSICDGKQYAAKESTCSPASSQANLIAHTIHSWLTFLEDSSGLPSGLSIDILVGSADTKRYQIYGPMLLFSSGAFSALPWQRIWEESPTKIMAGLWKRIADTMGVTHIAMNAPIPPQGGKVQDGSNVLRSPNNLRPLHGDFGPLVFNAPTKEDFETALWVSVVQNGITQVWAPRYTMFSRGNISEKTRVLRLPSVAEDVARGKESGVGCSAVDLYAGIGYFAFSYAKAGVDKVLCFEINPWSVEGLRRGAEANRWGVNILDNAEARDSLSLSEALKQAHTRLIVLPISNESAGTLIDRCRGDFPPVRHVNLGLLPSSRDSWATAVSVVDPVDGGWIHLHENIAIRDLEERSADILEEVQKHLQGRWPNVKQSPVLQHVERVKTYAPGVMHCVLDILIPPRV